MFDRRVCYFSNDTCTELKIAFVREVFRSISASVVSRERSEREVDSLRSGFFIIVRIFLVCKARQHGQISVYIQAFKGLKNHRCFKTHIELDRCSVGSTWNYFHRHFEKNSWKGIEG